MLCEDVLLTETITCWSTVSFVIQYQIGKLGRSLQHLLVLVLVTKVEWLHNEDIYIFFDKVWNIFQKQEAMFTVSYTKQLKESKKKVQDGYRSEK